MPNIKRAIFSVAVFIVLLVIIQVFISAIISSAISDEYLRSLLTLLISAGLSFYLTRKIINRNTRKRSY